VASRHAARLARRATGVCIDQGRRADCGMLAGPGPRRARALYRTAESRRMSDSTEPCPSARVSPPTRSTRSTTTFGRRVHCTDIEDGEVVVPTVDPLREIGDVLHDICDGLLEPDEADARPRR
jgi:hypothetical protein